MHFREYMKFTEISAFFIFSIYLFNPILSPYIKSLGFTDMQLSVLFSILPLSIVVFSPIVGKLSDISGRRIVIVSGIALEILAILLYIFSRSFALMSIARVFDAIAVVTVTMVSLAKVEDAIGYRKRGETRCASQSPVPRRAQRTDCPLLLGARPGSGALAVVLGR